VVATQPACQLQMSGITRSVAGIRHTKPLGHAGANQVETGKDTEKREGSRVHYNVIVDTHIEGAVWAHLESDVDTEILSKHGRRPGGLDRCDSIHAPLDRDSGHYSSSENSIVRCGVCPRLTATAMHVRRRAYY
jgi:hypothetical protein